MIDSDYGDYNDYEDLDDWDPMPNWADEDYDDGSDCHWVQEEGFCPLSGTEDCDFECPYRDYWEKESQTVKHHFLWLSKLWIYLKSLFERWW